MSENSGKTPGIQRRRLALGMALLGGGALLGGLPGAALAQDAARRGPLKVLATIGMVGDVVKEIGGDRIQVETLMGAGVDPHLYKATREDAARMLRADVIFYNGLVLEGKMTDAIIRVARAGRPVYAVTELLPEDQLIEPEGTEGLYDPHVWMDPRAWSEAAALIAERLIQHDPGNAAAFRENLAALRARMQALDTYAERAIASIPERQRVLVTAHDAFNYFARRYGIEVLGIQGLSTEGEAGVRRIQELVGILAERRVPAVFVETSVSDRNVQALVEGSRAKGHQVRIGGSLFSDAMGEPGTYEGTYIGMIDHNVTAVVRSLGGQAPERGFQNRLSAAK
ncbi:metal ABC transporter solute-binding protein, Zn/Mn family [Roseomonas marmotae]|uniref:Zinc ABC transporter substrate-binding protein n=1 Tax=Roseomonas marmotae TaxID=2768161 RepID=A0ABS3KBZ9_9PROT|nr:zinc ABC transporter substrate-binding protein [Roseomonas marmotae]MBO1074993.1 zinc ABC transporter substrate-binding protein [Roseomonas marmotae]QTI79970.1 zinc ABC transporter substrate-binding protein [Roseomonas marmotae]